MKCDFFEIVEGDSILESYVKCSFTVEERNLLAFVCAVDGVSLEKKFAQVCATILDMAKISLSLTGMSLKDAVKEWNESKVVAVDSSRFVTLFGGD